VLTCRERAREEGIQEAEIVQTNGISGPVIEEPSVSTGEDGKLHFFEEESDPGDNSFDRAYSPD